MIWLVALVVFVGLLVVAEWRDHGSKRLWKPLASAMFLWGGWQLFDGTTYAATILIGLAFGAIGDVLLLGRGRFFLAGLGSFLVGHLAYTVALMSLGATLWSLLIAAVMLLIASAIIYWLWGHMPTKMQGPVVAYISVITVMVAASPVDARMLVAAVAFAASDIFVARNRFVAPDWRNRAIGLPLYYGAQAMFVLSMTWF